MRNKVRFSAATVSLIILVHAAASNSSSGADKLETVYGTEPTDRFYGGIDYLMWWLKPAPLSVPLVTTGPIGSTHHGLVGSPAADASQTTVLYGAPISPAQGGVDSQTFPITSGARLTLGYWLDDEHNIALEGSGFVLQKQSAGYSIRGGADGNPVLGVPVHNSVPYSIGTQIIFPGEDSLPFSLPDDPARARANGIITGGINIENTIQLWGAGADTAIKLYRNNNWALTGLAGLRYLDLKEDFNLVCDIEGVTGPYAGQSGVVHDEFSTENHFAGINLGLRGVYTDGPFSVQLTPRIALGNSHEIETVSGGYYSYNFRAAYDYGDEGIFAQPSNEGQRSEDIFAFVPEIEIKISYALTSWLRASIGYDFIYYSNVIRPTDQIDRNIPKGQTFNQADLLGISTSSPAVLFNTTDFYAHGLIFGLEMTF